MGFIKKEIIQYKEKLMGLVSEERKTEAEGNGKIHRIWNIYP